MTPDSDPLKSSMPRGRVGRRRLASCAVLLAAALSTAGCAPKRVLGPHPPEVGGGPVRGDEATGGAAVAAEATGGAAVAAEALALVGVVYRPGGDDPDRGFDCSGFTRFVYAQRGQALPRQTVDQARWGRPVDRDGLSPGDLVFFAPRGRPVSHVGIWVGEGRFVHAPKSGQSVRTERLDDPYWKSRYAGARRP